MKAPDRHSLGKRLRAVIEAPLGERWRRPRIEASVFFTYTFHRQEFEEHLLPELFGLPSKGERSARLALLQLQFSHTHRPVVIHDAHVPVERDADGNLVRAAALAAPASFRLDTVPVRWGRDGRTCMHAKHILLRVRDEQPHRAGPQSEVLVVVTASANLTIAGWRQNIELADIQILRPGQATPLQPGLVQLLEDAWSWASDSGQPRDSGALSGLAHVSDFIDKLQPPLPDALQFPRLWTGRAESLEGSLTGAVADAAIGPVRRLSVGSPYLTEDAGPLRRLVDRLQPQTLAVLRPHDHQGVPMSVPAWERAVVGLDGLSAPPTIHALHPDLLDKDTDRTTHLKWIYAEGDQEAVLVLGSPNLSDPAFGPHGQPGSQLPRPGTNYETAVMLRVPAGLRLLAADALEPHLMEPSGELELDPNALVRPPTAPFLLTYDWAGADDERVAVVPLPGGGPPSSTARVRPLHNEGAGTLLVDDTGRVCPSLGALVRQALERGPFVELLEGAADPEVVSPLVTIVELNQEHAPARSRFGLSLDQFLRFVTAASLEDWTQAERDADRIDRIKAEEAESQGSGSGSRSVTALDRPIRIIQATQHLERRVRAALEDQDEGALARALFEAGGMSVRNLVDYHLGGGGDPDAEDDVERTDLVDQLVCWLGVRTLLDDLRPDLPEHTKERLTELEAALAKLETCWQDLEQGDRDQLKTWLTAEWRWPRPRRTDSDAPIPHGGVA